MNSLSFVYLEIYLPRLSQCQNICLCDYKYIKNFIIYFYYLFQIKTFSLFQESKKNFIKFLILKSIY